MAVPVYLFLYDEEGNLIKGDVDITKREGSIVNKGLLPHGNYTIGSPYNSPHTGKYTLSLTPKSSSNKCGRDAFKIHGINGLHPSDSSNGCIVAPLSVRKAIYNSGDTELIVR